MTPSKRRTQRGMSMMEVLVAMMIFTVVFLVALGLYQVANRAYLRTDAATIQQQNVRFAMDRMAESIRDAGANYNTLGANNVADEQVEGAWEAAVFVRGDFDNSRETALESTTFPIVTTGNDEIVGYVLRKAGGDANNTSTLTMKMDLTPSTGRNATLTGTTLAGEETATVHVAAVALADETNPPYQLTRVTFNAAGEPQYEVVAEDVFRLSFSYLKSDGTAAVATFGGADADRADRASVRQVDVNLVGMSSRPDPGYTDPAVYSPVESATTKNRRKLSLTQHIVPPNLGLKGHRHSSLPSITIQPPASIMVCTGHCQYFGVSWPASVSAGVTTYKVHVTAAAGANPVTDPAVDEIHTVNGLAYDYHQPTSAARAFSFSVAATTASGDSVYTSAVSATSTENAASVPSAPTGVIAAQNSPGENATLVNWTAVTSNTGPITASTCVSSAGGSSAPTAPWNITPIDLSYYKIYRVRSDGVTTGSFTAGPTNRVDNQVQGTLINVTPSGAYSAGGDSRGAFTDHTAAPCSAYFYRVQAFDYCDTASASSAAMGTAFSYDIQPTTIVPDVPGGTAGASTAVTGSTTSSGGNYNVTINWPAVTQTSAGVPAATAHYMVDRYRKVDPASTYSLDAQLDAFERTTFSDVVATTVSGSPATYQYYVRALYDCASPRSSTQAGPYTATCTPSGTMTISSPASGADFARPDVTALTPILATTGTGWTSANVTITGPSGATVYTRTISGAPSSNTYTFPTWDMSNTGTYPNGVYTISATASAGSCTTQAQVQRFTLSTVVCGLQVATSPAPAFQGSGANFASSFTFKITNTCTVSSITFNSLKFTWTGVDSREFISSITYGATVLHSGLTLATGGNGVVISLSAAQSLAPGATSPTVTLDFDDGTSKPNFTSDATQNGTPGHFTSIIAHETNFSPSDDELIPGSPIP
jgi:prepilin-type N-terminal cleavage/methylation domain-containing protein